MQGDVRWAHSAIVRGADVNYTPPPPAPALTALHLAARDGNTYDSC